MEQQGSKAHHYRVRRRSEASLDATGPVPMKNSQSVYGRIQTASAPQDKHALSRACLEQSSGLMSCNVPKLRILMVAA